MRDLITPEEATDRLDLIFPRTAFDTTLSSPLAGWAVAGMLYIDAVVGVEGETAWTRPSGLIWLQADVFEGRRSAEDRAGWREAAGASRRAVDALLERWELVPTPRFAENSRETLRDDILRGLAELGAVR